MWSCQLSRVARNRSTESHLAGALLQCHRALGSWAGPHSSSASPKRAALSPCHHSSHASLITLSRELHLSPDGVVGHPRQGVELQLFQLPLQITRAPHSHQMAGLEVTASEQQNPNTDEPHEQAHTFPQRAICSCSTNR